MAHRAGCVGLFIGFESVTPEGLPELGRKSAMLSGRNIPAAVERIHKHGMLVVGSFIMGLDSDRPGVGPLIATEALRYGVDNINVLFLTPLPGTQLWKELEAERRISMNDFPEDWQYYTLNYPVAHYKYLTVERIVQEMTEYNRTFYSSRNTLGRLGRNLCTDRGPLLGLVSNLTSRRNSQRFARTYAALWPAAAGAERALPEARRQLELLDLTGTASQRLRQYAVALKMHVAWFFRQS